MIDGAGWLQSDIGLDRSTTDAATSAHRLFTALVPIVDDLAARGLVTGWFFQRKPPDVRLRIGLRAPSSPAARREITAQIDRASSTEVGRTISGARWSAYEPETSRFGGDAAMLVAHRHFMRNAPLWHRVDGALRRAAGVEDGGRGHDPGRHQHRLTLIGLLAAREVVHAPDISAAARDATWPALRRVTDGARAADTARDVLGPEGVDEVVESATEWLGADHAPVRTAMRSVASELSTDLARTMGGSPPLDTAHLLALILHFDANRWGIDGSAQRWIADSLDHGEPGP